MGLAIQSSNRFHNRATLQTNTAKPGATSQKPAATVSPQTAKPLQQPISNKMLILTPEQSAQLQKKFPELAQKLTHPLQIDFPKTANLASDKDLHLKSDPAVSSALQTYLAQPQANESTPPELLGKLGFKYGSNAAPGVATPINDQDRPFIASGLPTPAIAKQLTEGGIGNVFNPEWQQLVASFVQQNGGLGNMQDGYLAFSSEYGFVRLRNTNLTPEQNRRFAEISLTMGMPVERLPSRSDSSAIEKPNVDKWANEFISKYDTKMKAFLADPSQGLQLKDGRLRFKLDVDPQSGRVISTHYKKAGALQSFFQKAMKYIGPIADAVSLIPGVGLAGIAVSQAIKFGSSMIAAGKATASSIVGALSGLVPMAGGALGASATQIMAASGVLNAGASLIDKGKLSFSDLAASVGPSLFTGMQNANLYQAGLNVLGSSLDKGKLDIGALVNVLGPAAKSLGINPGITGQASAGGNSTLPPLLKSVTDSLGINIDSTDYQLLKGLGRGIYQAIKDGKVSASSIAQALNGFVPKLADDRENQVLIRNVLNGVAGSIDSGRTSFDQVLAQLVTSLQKAKQEMAAV